ncbi:class I SAM-dependent methyltransferase [Acanthopleuribacter pedis]|uniref:Class I SAM-dependent methyltransferase n=1 Tax=Acanthopleuribacter pedis TaxID=442870 RepID=A0A8J7QE75_9BACT|nr:class I SAM-dependent methyltransferase [Acanthopleuribacter pedis]MBO1318020.1 class I SAM-dependent methyltransferase [Acanthopleuribacter pedis]
MATPFTLSQHWTFNLMDDPKRLAFVMARYQFVVDMCTPNSSVIELGCSEGIGLPLLLEKADRYTGVDIDGPALEFARKNWPDPRFTFLEDDVLGKQFGTFDCVFSLDVVEHIEQAREHLFFEAVHQNTAETGIAVVGTPNLSAEAYQSESSRIGHINLFSAKRLKACLQTYFHHVFLFGMNDELVHTGYHNMCHYLIALACNKKVHS